MIDYDKPASERYNEVYDYFKTELLDVEDFWWNTLYSNSMKQWFKDNIE